MAEMVGRQDEVPEDAPLDVAVVHHHGALPLVALVVRHHAILLRSAEEVQVPPKGIVAASIDALGSYSV